jgi:hypothetical protein
MTKQSIVRKLLEEGLVTLDEANVLLDTETITVPYYINQNNYWYSTVS